LMSFIIGGSIIGFIINSKKEKEKQIALQQKIMEATEEVNGRIRVNSVYYVPNNSFCHLFRDCIALSGNIAEGGVQQAFENNVTKLCETCVSRIDEYRQNCDEANNFKKLADDLNDNRYYDLVLDWCNKALQMRPDNTRMIELKQQIENKR